MGTIFEPFCPCHVRILVNSRFKSIESTWANKLIQYQYSIYNNRSSADFPLLFDTAIADALVLGPLRTEAVVLSNKELQKIKAYGVNAKTERLMITLAEYYIANKEPGSERVIIPRLTSPLISVLQLIWKAMKARNSKGLWRRSLKRAGFLR